MPWAVTDANLKARNYTVVYLGSTKTLNPAHTKIRRAMVAQCGGSKECHWLPLTHTSIDNSIAGLLSIYRKAVFCLCPPGDDPGRKAVFDSIMSGCIPVVFDVSTLFNQYPWHLGEELALDIAVNIPGAKVRTGKINFLEFLLNVSHSTVRAKQHAIARLAPRLQYSVPPVRLLENISDESPWDPPFLDAAEYALNGMLERTMRVVQGQAPGVPKRVMKYADWAKLYDALIAKHPLSNITDT